MKIISKTIESLDTIYKHLLEGVIIAAKNPKIELNKDTKTITLTLYKNTYIRVGFNTYHFDEDVSSFILYEDDCLIYVAYDINSKLIYGFKNEEESAGDNSICIGALLFVNGELESVSFYNDNTVNGTNGSILNIFSEIPITISGTLNRIKFNGTINVEYNGKIYSIKNHTDINLPNTDIIAVYYNPSRNRFVVNNGANSILVFTYNRDTNKVIYNPYPELVYIDTDDISDLKVSRWCYNYNEYNKIIEWEDFIVIDSNTGSIDNIKGDIFELTNEFGKYIIIFDVIGYKVDVILEPNSLPEKCIILDSFIYTEDGIEAYSNKINKLVPMEKELQKLSEDVNEKLINIDGSLVLPNKIYIVNDNPILKASMYVSGCLHNAVTVIDSNNNISYPCIEVRFNPGKNAVYSGEDAKMVEVYKYSLDDVNKDYKFGIISSVNLIDNSLPIPGELLFNSVTEATYENLVGIDTSIGSSPFMRIAGSLDKEKYPAWCFRRTGSKNELSYAASNDKSGDFYIFDLRYYLLSLGLNDNESLTHIIINCKYNNITTTLEAVKILYTLIHNTYPRINIGFAPMIKHGPRQTNTQINLNRKNCEFVNTIIEHINKLSSNYKVSVLPLWLYVNPMVNVEEAMIREVWNGIVGWACHTL